MFFFALLPPSNIAAQTATTIRHPLGSTSGSSRPRKIIEGRDRNLYGVSATGGLFDKGTVFKLDRDGANYQLLLSLNLPLGDQPTGLIEGSDGVLYGTTSGFSGTMLYRINRDGSGASVLRSFSFAEGYFYLSCVTQGSDGALYGILFNNGAVTYGTLFKINRDGSGYTVLLNFTSAMGFPRSGVIEGKDGLLYGVAKGV